MEKLTVAEQALYDVLKDNEGTTLSHEQLLSAMPTNNYRGGLNDMNLVAVHIRKLRKKLPKASIETERGIGYKLV